MDSEREAEVLEAAEAIRNLRGDGDFGAEGFIEVDKADPRNPVVRLRADRLPQGRGGGGGGGETPKAWTFVPGTGWTYPAVQVGHWICTDPSYFSGLDSTADGTYYLNVNVSTNELVVSTTPSTDARVASIEIGRVSGGLQTGGIYTMPIIFAYQ